MADHSEHVWNLSFSEEEKSVELEAFLEAHPGVDVNLARNSQNRRALHCTALRGHAASTRLLIDAKADLEARDERGFAPMYLASAKGNLHCLHVLIENKANVLTSTAQGATPAHSASGNGHPKCLSMLIKGNADVNARNIYGSTPAMYACIEDRLSCLQLLVDAKADLSVKNDHGADTVFTSIRHPANELIHRVPGMPFAVLSCNTDSKSVLIDTKYVTQATVDSHINEYTQIQNFIDECHSVTKHALNEDVVVDKRVGRRGHGIYHEPLEQVLLYLGLSMKKNQTVNASIDGKNGVKRALMPEHPTNANLWFQLYQRTHCSTCSARPAKLKKCTCFAAHYCNIDCQRQHWKTHKADHKAVMLRQKKKAAQEHKKR
jgi:hypothetical protein